jgi:hypothetical protein
MNFRPEPVGQAIVFFGLPPLHCLREEMGDYIVGQTIVFCGLPLGLPPWETAGRRHKTIVCPTGGRQ